jgi:hypothetical protein
MSCPSGRADPFRFFTRDPDTYEFSLFLAALRIRIRRIRMFLGLLDPDPLVRDMDTDPSIIKQK